MTTKKKQKKFISIYFTDIFLKVLYGIMRLNK